MGNEPICGAIEKQERAPLNAIGSKYYMKQWSTFKAISRQYFNYPDQFPYVLSLMNQNKTKFIDEYFDAISNEQVVLGDQFYHQNNIINVVWRRADDFINKKRVMMMDKVKGEGGLKVLPLRNVLSWIMTQKNLTKAIFKQQEITKEGLLLVYLPYFGSHKSSIEIVLDNYLPTNGEKYVCPLPRQTSIGALLIQKALAKLLGSYQMLHSKTSRQVLQMTIGIPCIYDNLGKSDEWLDYLPRFYSPGRKLISIQQEIQGWKSQYVKFSLSAYGNLCISLWQIPENLNKGQLFKYSEIMLELIKKQGNKSIRVGYASRLYDNKTILYCETVEDEEDAKKQSHQYLSLQPGEYYVHIFSLADDSSIMPSNISFYSEEEINLYFRKENEELIEIKKQMIDTYIKKQQKANETKWLPQCNNNVKSNFIWNGLRGILSLNLEKNRSKMIIRLQILPQYRRRIKFQNSDESKIQLGLVGSDVQIISFMKLQNRDFGRFYKLQNIPTI